MDPEVVILAIVVLLLLFGGLSATGPRGRR